MYLHIYQDHPIKETEKKLFEKVRQSYFSFGRKLKQTKEK